MGLPQLGPVELVIILVIVLVIFGAGRLGEIGGAFGKGIREFKTSVRDDEPSGGTVVVDGKAEPDGSVTVVTPSGDKTTVTPSADKTHVTPSGATSASSGAPRPATDVTTGASSAGSGPTSSGVSSAGGGASATGAASVSDTTRRDA